MSHAQDHGASHGAHYVAFDDLNLFYLDVPGDGPPLVLLHGLSANASTFGGLLSNGLSPMFRVIAPDLRGRARSSKPAVGYTMADHANDVIRLLDHLGLHRVILAGHSFGGYLAIYLTANYPERVERLIVIDAAITGHPRIAELLKPSLKRLTRVSASADAYLAELRAAPYLAGVWDDTLEQYFRAEIEEAGDGTVRSATNAAAIGMSSYGLACEPWLHWVQHITHPTLVLHADEPYGAAGAPPLMDEVSTRATANAFPDGRYVHVPGNHMTMLFGANAPVIVQEITAFVRTS